MSAPGTQYALFEVAEEAQVERPAADATVDRFSDFVVYVDESGDHSLTRIDPDYPIFVLALCVFQKRHYSEKIIPAVEKFKFNCNYSAPDAPGDNRQLCIPKQA